MFSSFISLFDFVSQEEAISELLNMEKVGLSNSFFSLPPHLAAVKKTLHVIHWTFSDISSINYLLLVQMLFS